MLSISQPSFPPIDSFLERVRTTDYRRLALSIWGAFVTACVYTYVAGQITRRGFNYISPHILTILRSTADLIERTIPAEAQPTTPPKLQHPPQQTKQQRRVTRSTKAAR